MKKKKKLVSAFTAAVLGISMCSFSQYMPFMQQDITASAALETYEDFTYVNETSYIRIISCTTDKEILEIPEQIDGVNVQWIESNAFDGCSSIKEVHLPRYIINILGNPFVGCTSLEYVYAHPDSTRYSDADGILFEKYSGTTKRLICYPQARPAAEYTIPDFVVSVKEYAFSGCHNIEVLNIGSKVESLFNATSDMPALKEINVSEDNETYYSTDGILFNNTGSLCRYPPSKEGETYTVPDGTIYISSSAFADAHELKEVILPEGVIQLGDSSFLNCTSLESINTPETLESVYPYAFDGCESLRSFCISSSCDYIYYTAFNGALNLEELIVSPDNAVFSSSDGMILTKDGTELIYCPRGKTGEAVVPEGTEIIQLKAFTDTVQLESISLPDSIKQIEEDSFENCSALENVDGVYYADDWVIDADQIYYAELREGTRGVADEAFYENGYITEAVLPESLKYIGECGFGECGSLQDITFNSTDCEFFASDATICSWYVLVCFGEENLSGYEFNGIIRGYAGSTAESYAETYGYDFKTLDEEAIAGDITCDGKASILDAYYLNRYLNTRRYITKPRLKAADINGDGTVNIFDMMLLRQLLLNQ